MKKYLCKILHHSIPIFEDYITCPSMEAAMEATKNKYNVININEKGFHRNMLLDGRFVSICVTEAKI